MPPLCKGSGTKCRRDCIHASEIAKKAVSDVFFQQKNNENIKKTSGLEKNSIFDVFFCLFGNGKRRKKEKMKIPMSRVPKKEGNRHRETEKRGISMLWGS